MLKRALAIAALGFVAFTAPAAAQVGDDDYVQDDVFTRDTTPPPAAVASQQTQPGGQALPRTGDDSTVPLGQLGAGLLVAGGVTVFVAKRRQHTAA